MIARTLLIVSLSALAACSKPASEMPDEPAAPGDSARTAEEPSNGAMTLAQGLTARVLTEGTGDAAEPGQIAVVHYTGWLYDEAAENKRGQKFDSSVDRGEYFSFMLGAGRVIKGWDQGVVGMKVGEKRELTIDPAMGYGDRGAGTVIPPGATLVFEIDLVEIQGIN